VSDRITRPQPWERDFTQTLRQIATDTETWAAEITDAHTRQTAPWSAYAPGLVLALTADEHNAGTGTGTATGLAASVALFFGVIFVKYRFDRAASFYSARLTLPSECRYLPCLNHASRAGGAQVPAAGGATVFTIGPAADGSLLPADTYLGAVRYTAADAPETGQWLLDHADYALDLNTILTK